VSNTVAFGHSVGTVVVRFGVETDPEVATVVGAFVGLPAVAFVVGAAEVGGVVGGRGVVERTVVEVAGDFEPVGEGVSAGSPATVGMVVCTAAPAEETALTFAEDVPGTPDVGAGVAAWAAQRQRPTAAIRRRADLMNRLTVHLPWGWGAGGGGCSTTDSHSGSEVPAINVLAKGTRSRSKRKEMASVFQNGTDHRTRYAR
jgi:hypothetical protein